LIGFLVHTDHRAPFIIRPGIDGQHIFHGGHERAMVLRGNTPTILQMRFKVFFF
jgi:hypothetical protein